jgi:hypothetical protein
LLRVVFRVRRRRIALLALVLAPVLLAAPPAGAQDGPRVQIAIPELVRQTPATLKLRPARGVAVTRVSVDHRDVTKLLRRGSGGARTARLPRRLLHRGPNHVVVYVRGRRGRTGAIARRFHLAAARTHRLVRLRAPRRVAGAAPVRLELGSVPHRLRVRLNGRLVGAALAGRILRTGTLGADDGLRFGRNRLEVLAWHRSGRWDAERRTIVVSDARPIPAAGRPRRIRAGKRIRLDARRSRPSRSGAPLAFRWRLAGPGARRRARLTGARSARPLLVTRRPGRVRVALTVTERGAGRRARAAQAAVSDDASVVVVPDLPPMGIPLQAGGTTPPSITLGDQRFVFGKFPLDPDNPGRPDFEGAVHIVVIDRETLEVVDRRWLGLQANGEEYQAAYQDVSTSPDAKERHLLWVAFGPPGCCGGPRGGIPNDGFSELLYVGTRRSDGSPLGFRNWGGTTRDFHTVGARPGAERVWLQQDNRGLFSVVPTNQVTIDSSSASTATENTIALSDRFGSPPATYRSEIRPGTSGFQLMAFDRFALDPCSNCGEAGPAYPKAFAVNTGDLDADRVAQQALAADLRAALDAGAFIVLQSIGAPRPTTPAWADIAQQLARIGASAHVFNTLDGSRDPRPQAGHYGGSYAVAGCVPHGEGSVLIGCVRPAESSYPLQRSNGSGTVTGLLTVGPDFRYDFELSDAGGYTDPAKSYGLAQVAYQDPGGPWPVGNTDIERAAMDYIAHALGRDRPKDGWCQQSSDLRAAYCADLSWDAADIPAYPGDGKGFCKPEWGSCQDEWTRVVEQLKVEWQALNDLKLFFDDLNKVLTYAQDASAQQPPVIADDIIKAIQREAAGEVDTSVSALATFALESTSELLSLAEAEPAGAAVGIMASAIAAMGELTHEQNDAPAFDLTVRGDELAAELGSAYLDNLKQVAVLKKLITSDWQKLNAIESTFAGALNDDLVTKASDIRRAGTLRWLWQEMVPSAWGRFIFRAFSAGKRIDDFYCLIAQPPPVAPARDYPFSGIDDAAVWAPVDHFSGVGQSLQGGSTTVSAIAAGTLPDEAGRRGGISLPPGEPLRGMFAPLDSFNYSFDHSRPGLKKPWFFDRAHWVAGQDLRDNANLPRNCFYP